MVFYIWQPQSNSAKYVKAPAPIDFSAYKTKLKFAGGAVDSLEKLYKSKSIPMFNATLPGFDAKKRDVMLQVVKSTVQAAKADLELQKAQLAVFEDNRITLSTSIGQLKTRFPHIAKEIESEIKDHQWAKDSM